MREAHSYCADLFYSLQLPSSGPLAQATLLKGGKKRVKEPRAKRSEKRQRKGVQGAEKQKA